MEVALESAARRSSTAPAQVSGLVRITTTDTILHGLVAPALHGSEENASAAELRSAHRQRVAPASRGAMLTWRCVPPSGRRSTWWAASVGPIRVALYAAKQRARAQVVRRAGRRRGLDRAGRRPARASLGDLAQAPLPKAVPRYRVSSIQSVLELTALGHEAWASCRSFSPPAAATCVPLTGALEDAETELWLLTHPGVAAPAACGGDLYAPGPGAAAMTWVMADQPKGRRHCPEPWPKPARRAQEIRLARMMFACPTGWSAIEACRT